MKTFLNKHIPKIIVVIFILEILVFLDGLFWANNPSCQLLNFILESGGAIAFIFQFLLWISLFFLIPFKYIHKESAKIWSLVFLVMTTILYSFDAYHFFVHKH